MNEYIQDMQEDPLWNTVFLTGEITQDTCLRVTEQLLTIDAINRTRDNAQAVTMYINSEGGDLQAAWQVCDIIDFIDTPVDTVGLGLVASSALVIFMAGDRRVLTPRTEVVSHSFSSNNAGTYHDMMTRSNQMSVVYDRMVEHYRTCTKLSVELIKENLLKETDTYLTAKQALDLGICDTVFEKKRNNK